ncbi:hypothetical protein ILUMI_05583, partial [Ignelater luminosus]
ILCTNHSEYFKWIKTKVDDVLDLVKKHNVFEGGHQNGTFTYIGRAWSFNELTVGKVICWTHDCLCLRTVEQDEFYKHREFEILTYEPSGKAETIRKGSTSERSNKALSPASRCPSGQRKGQCITTTAITFVLTLVNNTITEMVEQCLATLALMYNPVLDCHWFNEGYSISILGKTLKDIGFSWKKDDPRRGLTEWTHVAQRRFEFLEKYKGNLKSPSPWQIKAPRALKRLRVIENAGIDRDGKPVYIGQTLSEDKLIPETIRHDRNKIHAVLDLRAFAGNRKIKILCTKHPERFKWIKTEMPNVFDVRKETNLFEGGFEKGVATYIGRTWSFKQLTVGKVICTHTSCKSLNTVEKGHNRSHDKFEILTYRYKYDPTLSWYVFLLIGTQVFIASVVITVILIRRHF